MKPLGRKIQLDIEEVKIGAIQSDAIEEMGKIIAIGPDCQYFTTDDVGKTLYFKAWAIDVIALNGKKFYFISEDSDAICAIE